ncbi:MAG: hypothetical protein WC389_10025 [Lutibacter sp.]
MRITYKDIMKISRCSDSTARHKMAQLRTASGKKKNGKVRKDVTINDFAQHFGYDLETCIKLLK